MLILIVEKVVIDLQINITNFDEPLGGIMVVHLQPLTLAKTLW